MKYALKIITAKYGIVDDYKPIGLYRADFVQAGEKYLSLKINDTKYKHTKLEEFIDNQGKIYDVQTDFWLENAVLL